MVKVFKVEDLDCANCAAKIEEGISKLDGVNSVSVSFLAQKITLDADESKLDRIVDEMAKIAKKIEPDCRIIK
ncbi:MAG: heavy-metal-associated domain-containing protein [Clostridia bacterium]|nr:heavy-metal-associated domain-containing protein [Clostridia bacterium]MBR4979683.1 heavy-metal-associated domain-containing protein [Clostridia bacterium]